MKITCTRQDIIYLRGYAGVVSDRRKVFRPHPGLHSLPKTLPSWEAAAQPLTCQCRSSSSLTLLRGSSTLLMVSLVIKSTLRENFQSPIACTMLRSVPSRTFQVNKSCLLPVISRSGTIRACSIRRLQILSLLWRRQSKTLRARRKINQTKSDD